MAKPKEIADAIAESNDVDILLINGGISRGLDRKLINVCCARKRRSNVLVIIVTGGGDADAAYRMARVLQDNYEKFSVFLTGYCKSAGTLFLLGANEIVASEHGELGPLDVQMAKKDHLWGYESGLTVLTALTALHEKVLEAYEHFFLQTEFKSDHRISLRTASGIATSLTGAIFAPIYQQIDPMHVGEAFRSMAIARHYGERLMKKSGNFDGEVLDNLISGYPTHGFVIDRVEVEDMFNNVRSPSIEENELKMSLGNLAVLPASETIVDFLSSERREDNAKTANEAIEDKGIVERPESSESPAPPKRRSAATQT